MKLTVFYDGQFWVGVFEEVAAAKLKACRYVFGAEPKEEEILEIVNFKMLRLIGRTSEYAPVEGTVSRKTNPKRLSREATRESQTTGVSPKAWQALQKEREKNKLERKTVTRRLKEELAEKKRRLKREKAKDKHRGR